VNNLTTAEPEIDPFALNLQVTVDVQASGAGARCNTDDGCAGTCASSCASRG
jgi:FxLD family lantipeptide